ncbi:hypothetical protein KKE60_04120, partial [Patescibacteria group bacterium]|nr:hypothetical protein [Patescibacteria group bacterium]
ISTVPSQADLFRSIGENLGVGAKKGDVRLDAIIYYVQRTTNLDDLSSVWNALTEMGVANDVKKRWVKIYAQNLPGKEIPEELRERLEGGESERVKAGSGEIQPKPKRFIVVGGEIMGDPEGDYNFKEALQYVAQLRVASVKEGGSTLETIQALKDLGAFGKEGGGTLETIQTLKELGLVGKTGEGEPSLLDQVAKLTELGLLKKPGEEEGSSTIRALETQVRELTESLKKQEMDTVKSAVVTLANQLTDLRREIADGGRLEGRYALMDKAMATIDSQLTGLRSDTRPLLDTLARSGGPGPRQRSPEEQARIVKGLKGAVAHEREARALEDQLLFGVKPQPQEVAEVTPKPAPAPTVTGFSYE